MPAEVTENPDRNRYELRLDGELAWFAQYRDIKGTRVFTHTEVFPEYEGNGLGTQLIKHGLDDVRANGMAVVGLCPFVDAYLREHPAYRDLVDPELDVRLRD
jgi:predicted GNAT family acetyltransferase